jgi:hypothetical protein
MATANFEFCSECLAIWFNRYSFVEYHQKMDELPIHLRIGSHCKVPINRYVSVRRTAWDHGTKVDEGTV